MMDLIVLVPECASSVEEALALYYEEVEGAPLQQPLQSFADEIDGRFGDDDWPFTLDPIVCPEHVSLSVGPEYWEDVVPEIIGIAHRYRLVVLDPQYETGKLFPPGSKYE